MAPKTEVIEQLRARIAELEEENAWLNAESRDACLGLSDYYSRKLAAEQLNNKLLRKALEAVIKVHGYESGIPVEALSLPASTEALDAYVAEKVKDVQLQDIEQYLLQMAGISTAAIGYWKEDDSILPAYDTPALRDVAKLYANYESRTRQRDLAVEAMREALECGEDGDWQSARRILASVIKESKGK